MAREKGAMIARGRTAEIFVWKDSQVLKLYQDWCPTHWVEEEMRGTQAAYEAGLPVPAVEGVVEVGGRLGIVFERVDGHIMTRAAASKPWKASRYARMMAELHVAMHSCEVAGLPSQRQSLETTIQDLAPLPAKMKEALLKVLEHLPDGSALCHGDLHPDNIIMSSRGPIIIDWMGAKGGNPLADVARTSLILRFGGPPDTGILARPLLRLGGSLLNSMYLKEYLRLRTTSRERISVWLPLLAAARLIEPVPEAEKKRLLALVEARVKLQR